MRGRTPKGSRGNWIGPLIAFALALLLPVGSAQAQIVAYGGTTVGDDRVGVTLGDHGQMVLWPLTDLEGPVEWIDGERMNGLAVRLESGPLAGRTFLAALHGFDAMTADPEPDVVVEGDTRTLTGTYRVRAGEDDHLRVTQTVRHVRGSRDVRVAFAIENVSGAPVRFRATALAPFSVAPGRGPALAMTPRDGSSASAIRAAAGLPARRRSRARSGQAGWWRARSRSRTRWSSSRTAWPPAS